MLLFILGLITGLWIGFGVTLVITGSHNMNILQMIGAIIAAPIMVFNILIKGE